MAVLKFTGYAIPETAEAARLRLVQALKEGVHHLQTRHQMFVLYDARFKCSRLLTKLDSLTGGEKY